MPEPRRPLVALVVVALVPAVLLGALAIVGRSQADGVDTTPESMVPVVATPLATPALSLRRAPTALVDDRRSDVLAAALPPLLAGVDATSCAGVAVDDAVIAVQNGTVPVIPASNTKLITAAVALEVLGPDHVFTTEVRGPAPVNGVVDGDLTLVGGGDPVLSEAWYTQPGGGRKRPPIHVTDVAALADAVVAAGVTTVTGDIVGDDSRYDAERYPPSWNASLHSTTDAQPIGALLINDSFDRNGVIAADPAAAAAARFAALLRERGVDVGGSRSGTASDGGEAPLASMSSQPLSLLLNEMLATSDNVAGEMLVKELGVHVSGTGTRDAGLAVIAERLAQWGVAGVSLADGSGLSRDNRVTCDALLAVLRHGDAGDAVGTGLALADQAGTTLVDVFATEGLAGVLSAKTGSLTGVKALSGYFPSGASEVAFVLILNGDTAADYVARWSALTDALLASTGVPAPDAWAPVGAPS